VRRASAGPEAPPPRRGITPLDAGLALGLLACLAWWPARAMLVPTAGGPWRGVADPPSAAWLAISGCAAVVLAAALARAPVPVRRPLLFLGLAAAPLWVVATGRIPVLLVFQGPALVVLAAAVLCVAIARAHRARPFLPAVSGRAAFASAFAFYVLLGLRIPGPAGPQGDEPHYLAMAHSLLSDGDLDLADEIAHREYAPFFAGTLRPHTSPASPPGRLYPLHTPGLPLLLLPAYAFFGLPGTRLLVAAVAALAGAVVLRLLKETLRDDGAATAGWSLFAFTPPMAFYAVAFYPETPAALATAVLMSTSRRDPGARSLAGAALAAAVLPWLHPKLLPLATAGLALTLLRRVTWGRRLAAVSAFGASLGLLLWFMAAHYGRPSLGAAYGPGLSDDVSVSRLPWGLAALFLDRQFGLLAVSPAWLLALPGAALLARRRPGDTLRGGLLATAVLGVGASFSMWWGGSCPPARFVVPALPFLALAAAPALRARPDAGAALWGAGIAIVALAADAPRATHNRADGESALLRFLVPSLDLDGGLPSFVSEPALPPVLLASSLLAAAALAWRFGGRGLLAGTVGYAVVAGAMRDQPLVDRRLATAELLATWDPAIVRSPIGLPDLSRTSLDLALPGAPWTLGAGDRRISRRIDLPPGRYRVDVSAAVLESPPGAHVVRLDAAAGELVLAGGYLREGAPAPSFDLPLPLGARRLALTASGAQGQAIVEGAAVVPLAVVPRPLRAHLPWPRVPEPDRYRVDRGGIRVTVLDRTVPAQEGFQIGGTEGAFLVEARPGRPVRIHLSRPSPHPRDRLTWQDREIRLGTKADVLLILEAEPRLLLGPCALVPVRLRSLDAWIAFSADP